MFPDCKYTYFLLFERYPENHVAGRIHVPVSLVPVGDWAALLAVKIFVLPVHVTDRPTALAIKITSHRTASFLF